jgi:hypothetical protein
VAVYGVEEHICPGDSFVDDTITGAINDDPVSEPVLRRGSDCKNGGHHEILLRFASSDWGISRPDGKTEKQEF